jgi:hypothetical protein
MHAPLNAPSTVPKRSLARKAEPTTDPDTRTVVPIFRQVPTIRRPLPVEVHTMSTGCEWSHSCNDSSHHWSSTAQRTGQIARHTDGHPTTLRLIGHLQAEHLEPLQAHMEGNGPRTVLDLDEVTLVMDSRALLESGESND